jgi:hypothetical protein
MWETLIFMAVCYKYDMQHKKDTILQIRCSKKTKQEFKILAAKLGTKSYEDLLRMLMERAKLEWYPERVY